MALPGRLTGQNTPFSAGFAPISLVTPSGKVGLRAEWAYAGNKSLSLNVAVPRATRPPGWFINNVEVDGEGNTTSNDFYNFGLVLENRFYLMQDAPLGFYLAPYARYNKLWLDRTTQNPEKAGETTIRGTLYGAGIGGAVGWQIGLGKRFTVDATFAAIDLKWMRGNIAYASTDPNNDIYALRDEVQAVVEDIPLIGKRLTPQIDGDEVKVRTPSMVLPAYRFSLTVNYRL
jgi:hypothetical protein